jgi:hypothetical protein
MLRAAIVGVLLPMVVIAEATAITLVPGDILVADRNNNGGVFVVDPDTGETTLLAFLSAVWDVGLDPNGQVIAVNQNNGNPFPTGPQVHRIDPETLQRTVVANGAVLGRSQVFGMAIDNQGDIWLSVSDPGPPEGPGPPIGTILRVNGVTGAQTVVTTGEFLSHQPGGLAFDSSGRLIVADFASATGSIIAVDSQTGSQTLLSATGLGQFTSAWIALESDGDYLVTDLRGADSIVAIDGITGERSTLFSGGMLSFLGDLEFDLTGNLVVADEVAGLVLIDLLTGEQTLIAAPGGFFTSAAGIAIVPIPEPSTALMLALGLVGIAASRRRTAAHGQ